MDATNDASHDASNLTRSTPRETNPDSHDHVLPTPSQPPSDARSSEATTQGGNDVELVAERSTPKGTTEYMTEESSKGPITLTPADQLSLGVVKSNDPKINVLRK